MKTIILTVFTVSLTIVSYSQEIEFNGFSKGDFIISGSANFYSNSNEYASISTTDTLNSKYKNTNISIVPEIGFFLTDHFMLGLNVGYLYSKSKRENNLVENESSGYTTGITGRYYFSPKKRVSFYTEISGSYSKTEGSSKYYSQDIVDASYDNTNEHFSLKLIPGVNIFIHKNFAVTSKIGYFGYSNSKYESTEKLNNRSYSNNSKGISASLDFSSFYLGILYRL